MENPSLELFCLFVTTIGNKYMSIMVVVNTSGRGGGKYLV